MQPGPSGCYQKGVSLFALARLGNFFLRVALSSEVCLLPPPNDRGILLTPKEASHLILSHGAFSMSI